jgi:hypothetical protein
MNRIITKAHVLICFLIAGVFANAQPGVPATPYCYPANSQCPCNNPGPSNMPGNFVNDFIHSVITYSGNVDINNVNSGCNAQNFPSIGCRNYIYHKCQHNLSVTQGQVVTFSIQVGQIYPQGVVVYVDWNNDILFSAAPEKIGWTTTTIPGGTWFTFTTTIPPAQPSGTYRMRVRCAENINGGSIDPCLNYLAGETEDYDVYVGTTSPVISNLTASSNSTLCSGNTLSLTSSYTSQCTPSFTWAGPNGFFSSVQDPTITNAQQANSGNYTVTVSCGTACPVSVTTSVTIDQSPTTANAGTIICTCATTTTLNANTPSIGTGSWTLISGSGIFTNPTSPNTMMTAIGVGTNVIQWTITNGNCVSTSTTAVIRDMVPTISVAGPNQTITCSGNTATMQANNPAVGVGTWSLISGSGTFVSPNSPTTTITGIGSGTNVYMWIITNPTYCNCQPGSTSTLAVVNYTSINVAAVSSPTAVCVGFNSSMTASGAQSYTWTGNTFTGSIVGPTLGMPAGTYTVVGDWGACSDTAAVTVATMPPPSVTLTASSYTKCPSDAITLTSNGASSYSYSPCAGGFLNSCVGTSVISTAQGNIVYTVIGSVPGCTASAVVSISVIPAPIMGVSSTSTLLCAGDQATLTVFGALSYTWIPAGSGSSIVISPTVTTTYTVIGSGTTVCNSSVAIAQNVSPCTGVIGNSSTEKVRVYPNPFKDELKIVSTEPVHIKLVDITGKEVLRKEINGEIIINTSSLAKGVYFIHFSDKVNFKPVKLIKD